VNLTALMLTSPVAGFVAATVSLVFFIELRNTAGFDWFGPQPMRKDRSWKVSVRATHPVAPRFSAVMLGRMKSKSLLA
jgi:hypothetical protein